MKRSGVLTAAASVLASAVLMSSCMVGPKYAQPATPLTPSYRELPPDSFKESKDWALAKPNDQMLRGKWWEAFGDSQLDALEEQVDPGNLDLKADADRYQQARATVRVHRADQFPTISTTPYAGSVRESSNQPYFNPAASNGGTGQFTLPFDLNYEIDLWGRVRRTVTAAREEAQATAADLETARLSIHSELAYDYFELRSADAQKKLLDDTVKAYASALQLTRNRFEGGASARSDVAQAQTQLDTTQVQDTDVGVMRAQYEHAIAILIGKPPAAFSIPPVPLNMRPPEIPVGVPSQLLERRPDIAAMERRVAEANEQIGIARASFYPTVILSPTAGLEGTSLLNWFTWPSRFWGVGPNISQTLFDAGRRRATLQSANLNYDALVNNYRQTTLTAFQQVEDNLSALRILEREAQQQQHAVGSAEQSLELFTNRYRGGVDTYLQVITAQTIALENERNDVDIMRRRMDASVLLIKALGGGWNVSQLPAMASMK